MEKQLKDGISKWDINLILDKDSNKVPNDNGYFGKFTIVRYNGKENIVFCDDRNAECVFVSDEWFDEIVTCGWGGDYRYNDNKPAIVRNGKDFCLLTAPHGAISKGDKKKKLISDWFNTSKPKWYYNGATECVDIVLNGKEMAITKNGTFITEDPKPILEAVKNYTKEQILNEWINKGKPCFSQYGLTYRGAKAFQIDKQQAINLLPKYSFGKGFYELSWRIVDGIAALVFNEYSVYDME
jgi:hypothetical protein